MEVVELTRKLIDIPSVSGEEGDVGEFLADFLGELGYQVELQPVAERRWNVLATWERPARVVFSTHIDTVPPFIPSREDGDFIHGRGACDAKGILAAQVAAAERLRASDCSEIGLLFLVDEEMGSSGARAANLHEDATKCRFLINGEPTENRLAIGSKGSVRVAIHTEGRAGHSAYPEIGESAIETLLDILSEVRATPWPRDNFFGETTCNIGLISGGTRPNIIPAGARADLQIRLVSESKHVLELLERIVDGRGRVEVISITEPVRMLPVPGFDQDVVRFTTDIPHLHGWGKPLLLGPGSILDAHTAHERVSKKQLSEAVDLYVRLVQDLLSKLKDE